MWLQLGKTGRKRALLSSIRVGPDVRENFQAKNQDLQ